MRLLFWNLRIEGNNFFMNEYTIKYSGAVVVTAKNKDEAENKAWCEHAIRFEDIESIEKED